MTTHPAGHGGKAPDTERRVAPATWPLSARHYGGVRWEVVDRDGIVWALTWSEGDARTIATAVNEFRGTNAPAAAELDRLKAINGELLAALREIAQDEDVQYGFFPGGDPRKFSPDSEDCTEAERAAHKEACRIWDEAEAAGRSMNPEEPSGSWLHSEDGKTVLHRLKANFGIGTYNYPTHAAQVARAAISRATGDAT